MRAATSSGSASDDSDVAARPNPNAFTVLYEKALSQQVLLGCWCPTMDLLALVSDDGQLSVHRLEWQKLWVACPDTPITALCWRPDGKVLATGHRHGAVSLYNVEACELFRTLRAPLAAPVCHLSWVQGLAPNPATATPALHLAYRYRHTRFFPAPPPGREQGAGSATTAAAAGKVGAAGAAAGAAGGSAGVGAAVLHEWPPPPDSLDVLVTSNTGGGVSIFACGEVMVASLPPRANGAMDGHYKEGKREMGPATAAAACGPLGARGELPGTLQALLSRDLNFLLVVSEPAAAAEATDCGRGSGSSSSGGGGGTSAAAAILSVYGCGKLGSCQEEILELSLLGGLVAGRLEAAAAALAAAARAWKGAAAELSKRMDEQLREALASHGHDPDDALGELTCMLASGHVSAPLHAFLTGSLTEAGLRRLAKTVDLAVQEVSSQLLDGVLPALQIVVFVMGELRGRARTASITQTLGLQERAVAVAEVEAVKALIQVESLRQLVTRVGCQYRVFFTWLLKTLQSLEETRPPSAEGPMPGGPMPGAGSLADAPICLPTLLAFLEEGGQLSTDAVARDLDASQSTLGLPVGSLTFPPDLLPHLKALQEAAFPMPPPEEAGATASEAGGLSPSDGGSAAAGPSRGTSGGGAAGAGESSSGGSSWPDKPLQRQLGLLVELSRVAFGRLQKDVSPSVQLLTRIPLLPAPSPERWVPYGAPSCGDGSGECGRRCSLQLPQIRTDPPVGKPALLACVLPAVTLSLPLGDGDRDVLLLMQVALKQQGSRPQARACLLTLPHGLKVFGLSYYRSAQLALLLGPSADPRVLDGGSAVATSHSPVADAGALLALVPTEGLRMSDVSDIGGGGDNAEPVMAASCTSASSSLPSKSSVAQICAARGAVVQWPVPGCRLRRAPGAAAAAGGAGGEARGPGGGWLPPLLVSGPRGLAAAFTEGSRSMMIDLEEDEEGQGDEEEEAGGGQVEGEEEGDNAGQGEEGMRRSGRERSGRSSGEKDLMEDD